MNKIAIYRPMVFALIIFFAGCSGAKKETSTITISGKVIYPGYKSGQRIKIVVKDKSEQGLIDVASVDILQPGRYSLKVPKEVVVKRASIGALVIDSAGKPTSEGGRYTEALEIGETNINGIDIVIKAPTPVNENYNGPTVNISGNIDFPAYKNGQRIRIFAKTYSGPGPADIAYIDIPEPGAYVLKVPKGTGRAYVGAIVVKSEEVVTTEKGRYKNSPLEIQDSDLTGIDITIR